MKQLKNTKLRLKKILNEDERARLSGALLRKVLQELERSEISGTIVVYGGKAEELTSPDYSKITVISESKENGGVNSAVNDGIALISRFDHDPEVLLLPSDLPYISAGAINNVIDLLGSYDLVINPSSRKDGTNLLAFRLSNVIPLHYDQNSYDNHLKEAKLRNLNFISIEKEEFLQDLDDQEDLDFVMEKTNNSSLDSLIISLNGESQN